MKIEGKKSKRKKETFDFYVYQSFVEQIFSRGVMCLYI